ncbi:universal stress protein [Pontibacter silvestris]|uniref:Universal stress protein n=1 Tax=Pontibacter silvestris TaxID=2305183 RepID=A0ABW4X2T9_9BACT|nr:universal stress protein [Pontibacter silvestris]MCC9135122.1 universal stress protein [Pontibacter silvestris]
MNTILVPIDFSQNAECNFVYGLELAKAVKARLVLLHVFYPIMSPPAAYDATDVIYALEKGKAKELELFARQTTEAMSSDNNDQKNTTTTSEIQITYVAKLGVADEQIIKVAKDYNTDLVVMGMQGGGAVCQTLLGSTTISVIQSSTVPVLVLPKGSLFKGYKATVFATNLCKVTDGAVLDILQNLIQPFDTILSVLHLYKNEKQQAVLDTQEAIELISEHFTKLDYKVYIQHAEDVAAGILDYIQKQKADLVALVPQKHTFFERLLDKSITGRITALPVVPVLALPNKVLQKANQQQEVLTEDTAV